jgi:hypothetical protein
MCKASQQLFKLQVEQHINYPSFMEVINMIILLENIPRFDDNYDDDMLIGEKYNICGATEQGV